MTCRNGHGFDLELTKDQFIERTHRCPICGSPSKRSRFAAGIGGGLVVPGCRAQYPYYNWQLPLKPGQTPGEPNVLSKAHEDEICAGAYDGDRWERNQL